MGVQLSDSDLIRSMEEGRLSIKGFRESNLTPNGYDLTIGEVLIPSLGSSYKEGQVAVPPKTWFLVGTVEYLKLGVDLTGDLWIRTSWARRGIIPSFGKVDAGFEGTLTLSAFNASDETVALPIGETFAQISLLQLKEAAEADYAKRSGNYQGQSRVTLSKSSGPERSETG